VGKDITKKVIFLSSVGNINQLGCLRKIERPFESRIRQQYLSVVLPVAIIPQEFHFFYAFQFREPGNPRIVVKSYAASRPQSTSNLAITVQPLGQLGPYTISVLHVKRSSYAGQVLSLQITSPGESRFTGRLRLLNKGRKKHMKILRIMVSFWIQPR